MIWLGSVQDYSSQERETTEEEIVDQASAARTIAELQTEIAQLNSLETLAQQVKHSGKDRKWEELSQLLQNQNEMFAAGGYRRKAERSLLSECQDIRNSWAHNSTASTDDTYRALDSIGRLLSAVSAPEAETIEKQKQELLRVRFQEQAKRETRRAVVNPTQGQPAQGLKPWREIVTPHQDVAKGYYQQAEFAADLWQVYLDEGSDEYRDPTEFFRRTYLTEGLKQLLMRALLPKIMGLKPRPFRAT